MCFVILPVRGRAPAWAIATDTLGAGATGRPPRLHGFLLWGAVRSPRCQSHRTHGQKLERGARGGRNRV